MSKIKYIKGSLFDVAEPESILIHAVNCRGVWGSGIAKEFKIKFPQSFEIYHYSCSNKNVGEAGICKQENGYSVGCLYTSESYGKEVDDKDKIIVQTTLALNDLVTVCLPIKYKGKIYSNKFNSGLFGVPWEETEKILAYFVERYNLDWTVTYLE